MLNEKVLCDNIQVQSLGVKWKEKNEVKVKKKEGNVALVATQGDEPAVCWYCGKPGHFKAFCNVKPL